MFKTKQEIIVIQAEAVNPIPTNVVFWSHDHGTAKLIFQLKKDQIFQSLPDGTIVPVCLEFNSATAENGRGKHIYHAVIEDAINGIVSIVLEDNVLGYQGIVDGSIYIELPDSRSLDTAGRFTFAIKRSPIDDSTPELEDYYYQGFEQILSKSKSLIDGVKKDCQTVLDNLTAEVKDLTTQTQAIQQKQADIQEQIDSGKLVTEDDVYLKDKTFNKVESSANVIYQIVSGKKEKIVFSPNFSGKVSGSLVENANSAYIAYSTALNAPTAGTWYEFSDERYSKISDLDDIRDVGSHKVNGQMVLIRIEYDVVDILTSVYSNNFWLSQGISTLDEKVTYIKNNVSEITPHVFGFGSGPSGNRLQLVTWRPDTKVWNDNGVTAINSTNQVKDIYAKHSPVVVDQYGKINILLYSYVSDGTIPSGTSIDYSELEIALNISANEHIESMFAANQVESIATGEEAEAGESNSVFMTPNLVFKAIAKWVQGKFVSTAGNETILGTKNFQDGIQVKGKLPVLTKSVNDYASVDKNNNASVISDGSMRLYRRGDIVYLTGSFKLSAAKYNQAVWFNVPSWAAPIDRPRMYWSSGSNFYLLAFDPSTINNIICIDNVAQDTWLTGSFCWLARDPY